MEPTEALRRLAHFCGEGTGITGVYPITGAAPKPPFAAVFWTGGRMSQRGGEQELLMTAEIRLCVADINQAEKVAEKGDGLITTLLDRFRLTRDNPAISLYLPEEDGDAVKHCHIGRGGDEPLPFTASQSIPGWGANWYGAVFPVEIKLTRTPERIP
jgi:hypothetical protein